MEDISLFVIIILSDNTPDIIILVNIFLFQYLVYEATTNDTNLKLGASKIRGCAGDLSRQIYTISEVSEQFMAYQTWGIW